MPVPPSPIDGEIRTGTWQIGRLAFAASASPPRLAHELSLLFKQSWRDHAPASPTGSLTIHAGAAGIDWDEVPDDAIAVRDAGHILTLRTRQVAATLHRCDAGRDLTLVTRTADPDDATWPEVRVHLSIVLHRLLLALDALYLHAAAVHIDGRTHVFIGEKGAGKSTLSLALGRAGGTVLADDHVLIERRHDAGHYVVSGCEDRARLAADAETWLFDRPLPGLSACFAGTWKKEFAIGDYVSAAAFTPFRIDALHFPVVGTSLTRTARSRAATVIELLGRTRRSFRPQGPADVDALLDFWGGLVAQAPAFNLELPGHLPALSGLPALLRA